MADGRHLEFCRNSQLSLKVLQVVWWNRGRVITICRFWTLTLTSQMLIIPTFVICAEINENRTWEILITDKRTITKEPTNKHAWKQCLIIGGSIKLCIELINSKLSFTNRLVTYVLSSFKTIVRKPNHSMWISSHGKSRFLFPADFLQSQNNSGQIVHARLPWTQSWYWTDCACHASLTQWGLKGEDEGS